MKKLLVLLLALTMVGAAFAQVSFSGYLDTGFVYEKIGSADATLTLNGDDSGTTSRFNLNGSWKSEDGVVGAAFRFRTQGDFDAGSPVLFTRRAYVWGTMFDGMVKLVAGKLGDYTWATLGPAAFGNIDGPTGVQFQVMPIEGLNLGFFLPATTAGALAEDAFGDILIGASYAMADVFTAQAGIDLSPTADSNDAWAGVEVTAIENLYIVVEASLTDLGNDATGATYLFEEAEYSMDALVFGIDLEQQFWADSALDMGLSFGPYVSYTMDMVTLGGQFTYITAGDSGMIISPYVRYAMGKGADLELRLDLYTGDITDVEATALADNTTDIILSFTWSF